MLGHILRTFLELGHATSQNLGFAHRNEAISFGEETITETDLLGIARQHPNQVRIWTFPKRQESLVTGADWEWHIIGHKHTLKMRVQAKRVNKLGGITGLSRQAATSPKPQIDLLLFDSNKYAMRAAYCFYSSESQRKIWIRMNSAEDYTGFEAGCLLSDARIIKRKMPKRLSEIEQWTVPWHYLWSVRGYQFLRSPYIMRFMGMQEYSIVEEILGYHSEVEMPKSFPRFPTVAELNEGLLDGTDRTGISATEEGDGSYYSEQAAARERNVKLLMVIDVRSLDLMLRHFEGLRG